MNDQATYDDATLLLRLYDLRREASLRQAREWFLTSFRPATGDEFLALCPPGSKEETWFRMVYSYWEMAASLVTMGVLNEELFIHNNSEALVVWERLKPLVPGWRDAWANPKTVKHLEEVAEKAAAYLNQGHPKAYATFTANIR